MWVEALESRYSLSGNGKGPVVPPPEDLVVTPAANVPRIDIQWDYKYGLDEPDDGSRGFTVERSGDGVTFSPLATLPIAVQNFADVDVAADSTYTYRVRSFRKLKESASVEASAHTADFRVFSAMLYQGQPDLGACGVESVLLDDRRIFEVNGQSGVYDFSTPDKIGTQQVARDAAARGVPFIINVEHFPVDIRNYSKATVDDSINKLGLIVDWAHAAAPDLIVGFYSILPIRDYYAPYQYRWALANPNDPYAIGHFTTFATNYQKWKLANDYLRPLADKVDVTFPSVYTFYDDESGWEMYARENIAEAHRYGKPVYPFLMTTYHESNTAGLAGKPINGDFWQFELDLVRQTADGLVIFGGFQRKWDDSAGWWTATEDFLDGTPSNPLDGAPTADPTA